MTCEDQREALDSALGALGGLGKINSLLSVSHLSFIVTVIDHTQNQAGFSSLIVSFQELRRLERKVSKLAKTLRKLGYSDLIEDVEGQEEGDNTGADNKTDADVNNCK